MGCHIFKGKEGLDRARTFGPLPPFAPFFSQLAQMLNRWFGIMGGCLLKVSLSETDSRQRGGEANGEKKE